jgi:hypothetical protein
MRFVVSEPKFTIHRSNVDLDVEPLLDGLVNPVGFAVVFARKEVASV